MSALLFAAIFASVSSYYTRGPRRCLAGLLALLATSAQADDPRVTSILRSGDDWRVSVTGIEAPRFVLDGRAVSARPGPDRTSWEFNADGQRLVVAGDGQNELLALRLGPDAPAAAPFNDWTVYHIMLAYFANGDAGNDRSGMRRWVHTNYAGGDLQGLLSKVDYLKSLGVNAVWLSPVFAAETSHGYDVMNYYRVGDAVSVPRDRAAARALFDRVVEALHGAGIRVILDLPLDYAAGGYERRDGDPRGLKPKYTGPIQEAEKLWSSWNTGFRYWNFDDADTRAFLEDVGRFWLTDGRVDGFRLDYVRGVPHDFWAEFYVAMKDAKPGAFLFGEAWQDAAAAGPNAEDIAEYYRRVPPNGMQFDGLLDFPMQIVMSEVFARGIGKASELERWLQYTAARYGADGRPVYFLDNHDLSRFLSWAQDNDRARLLAALGFMASLSSPVVLYYGTETGLRGGRPALGFNDMSRVPMPWGTLDTALIEQVSRVLKLRSELPAITHGGRLPLYADDSLLVMRKTHPAGDVLVAVNVGDSVRTVTLPPEATARTGGPWTAALGATAPEVLADGSLVWKLPPITTCWAK